MSLLLLLCVRVCVCLLRRRRRALCRALVLRLLTPSSPVLFFLPRLLHLSTIAFLFHGLLHRLFFSPRLLRPTSPPPSASPLTRIRAWIPRTPLLSRLGSLILLLRLPSLRRRLFRRRLRRSQRRSTVLAPTAFRPPPLLALRAPLTQSLTISCVGCRPAPPARRSRRATALSVAWPCAPTRSTSLPQTRARRPFRSVECRPQIGTLRRSRLLRMPSSMASLAAAFAMPFACCAVVVGVFLLLLLHALYDLLRGLGGKKGEGGILRRPCSQGALPLPLSFPFGRLAVGSTPSSSLSTRRLLVHTTRRTSRTRE